MEDRERDTDNDNEGYRRENERQMRNLGE